MRLLRRSGQTETLMPDSQPSLAAVEDGARFVLATRGLIVTEIVRVTTDSILFIGPQGRPMTAWLSKVGSRVADLVTESGFSAEPPAWVVRQLGHVPGQRPDPETTSN